MVTRNKRIYFGALLLSLAAGFVHAAAPLVCDVNDIVGIAARRKAVREREALKALGIESMPLTAHALSEADHKLDALAARYTSHLLEGDRNTPSEITRFKGFSGKAEASAAEERAFAGPVKVKIAPEENFSAPAGKISYTDGIYKGPKEHANVGLYAGTFDPPRANHLEVIQRSLKEGKLDEVYVFVNRAWDTKPGATEFAARQRMAELAFGGDRRVKFLDPADYKNTGYSDLLRDIAAKNRRNLVTSISDDEVLAAQYFRPLGKSNIRYLVSTRAEDADMVESAIKARFGASIEKDPGLVRRLDSGEHAPILPETVAKYIGEKKLYRAPDTSSGRNLASVFAGADRDVRYSLVGATQDGLKERLEKAIKNSFDLGEPPELRGAARIPTRAESETRLRDTAGLWSIVRPNEKLKGELDEIIAKGAVSDVFAADSKELRARLKVMRFLCESLCTEDTQLNHLDQLTKAFGHLDDAAKPGFGSKDQITIAAKKLREEMSKDNLKAIDHELAKMEPLHAKELADRIEADIKGIRKSIYSKDVSETEFHEVRKNIGRMQTVVLSNALSDGGKAEEKASYQVFRNLYDRIGEVHDGMVKSELHGVNVGRVSFTDAQRGEIEKVLGYFEKSEKIEPGKLPKGAEKFADRDVRYSLVRSDAQAGLSDQIKALIKNGSNTGEAPQLSGMARLPLRRETEDRMREIAKLWDEVRPGDQIKRELAEISRTGKVSAVFLADTKELRARLKVMRFFCEALCTEGTQLERLDKLTKTFGHLSDAATPGFGTAEQIRAAAIELRGSLSKENLKKIDYELAKMEPLRAKDLASRLEASFAQIRKSIYSPSVAEEDFHEVRKAIGRMQTVLLSNAFTEGGTKEEKASLQAFRQLYDSIGEEHDEMVKSALQGAGPKKIAFTDSQRFQIEQMIGYFEKNDRIEPGKLPAAARKFTNRDVRFSLAAQSQGAGLSRDRAQALAAIRSGYAAKFKPAEAAAYTDGLFRRLSGSSLDPAVVRASIEGAASGSRNVEEAAELTEQLAGQLTRAGYPRDIVAAAVGGAVGGPRSVDEAVKYARIVVGELQSAGFDRDSVAAALRGSIGGKFPAEEAVAYSRNVAADLEIDGYDKSTVNAALRGGSSGDITARQASSFTRDLAAQLKDAGISHDISVAAIQSSLGKNLDLVEARSLTKDLVGKLTQQGFDHETMLAAVEGGAIDFSSSDRAVAFTRQLAGDPGAVSRGAGSAFRMVAEDDGKVSRGLASVSESATEDLGTTLEHLKSQKTVSPLAYAALLEKASPAEQSEIRRALGSKVAVTADGEKRFLKLAGVDPRKSEYREFLKEETAKPIALSKNGYDKTKSITKINAIFDGFNSDLENGKFKRLAEAANMGQPSSIKRSFLIETAVTKDLNDTVVKNKELVTSLMNNHKKMMWEAISKDSYLMSHMEAKYSDFKSMKFGFNTSSAEIDHRMKRIFSAVNARYSGYLASVAADQGWDQAARGLVAEVENWTHMGIGTTPDEANWAARQSRTMFDGKGITHPRSFAEVEDRARKDMNEIAGLRRDLSARLGAVPGMFVEEGGKKVFSAETIEAIRKAKPLTEEDEAITAAVKKAMDARFDRQFTTDEVASIRAYAAKVDSFSPDLYLDKRVETPLTSRRNGIVSADFKGQNARNIEETMKALARTEGYPLTTQMREIRRGEQIATAALERKKSQFLAAVTKLDPASHDFVYFSGDDGIFLPSRNLTVDQKQQLARDVAEADLRLTYNWHSYADTGTEISSQKLSGFIGEAEDVEKSLRKEMIQHFPREQLNRAQFAIDMSPLSTGQKSVGVYVGGANTPSQTEAMQKWIRGSLERHGHEVDFVEAIASRGLDASPISRNTDALGDAVYSRDALAELERSRPALAAVVHYREAGADALADARRRYLSGQGSLDELKAVDARYGGLGFAVNNSDEGARRVGYLSQEEGYLAHLYARASVDGDTALAEKIRVEQAAVTASMLGEQQHREALLAGSSSFAQKARHGAVDSARKNLDRYAREIPGGALEKSTGGSDGANLLRMLLSRDAEAGQLAAKESRERLEAVVLGKLTSANAPINVRVVKSNALAQDIVDLHAAHGKPGDLAKRSPERWNKTLVDSCVKVGLCTPKFEARSAAALDRELSPIARQALAADEIARAPAEAADEAFSAARFPNIKNYDDVMAGLEADRKQLAADAERLSQDPALKEVENDTRRALSSLDSRVKALDLDRSIMKQAHAMTAEEEHLSNQAAEATLSYLRHAEPGTLEGLGLHGLSLAQGEDKAALLERAQTQLKALPASKRSEFVAAVFNDASRDSGEFSQELRKVKLDQAGLSKALEHSDSVTAAAGVKDPTLTHAVLREEKVAPSVQALADAVGATKAGAENGIERQAAVAAKMKQVEAETRALTGKTNRSPASLAIESLHDHVGKELGPLKFISDAQKKEIEKGLEAVAAYEKSEINARHIFDTLTALAMNPATKDQFETDRMAFVEAAKALPEKKSWSKAWEEGVKRMLQESDYKEEEIMKVVDQASGTRFYQQTAHCLAI